MKIDIFGISYEVVIVEGVPDMGDVNAHKAIIRLCPGTTQEVMRSTLFHEIIEALNYQLELKLEHHQIQSLEAGLFSILTKNKDAREFIFAGERKGKKNE